MVRRVRAFAVVNDAGSGGASVVMVAAAFTFSSSASLSRMFLRPGTQGTTPILQFQADKLRGRCASLKSVQQRWDIPINFEGFKWDADLSLPVYSCLKLWQLKEQLLFCRHCQQAAIKLGLIVLIIFITHRSLYLRVIWRSIGELQSQFKTKHE